MLYYIELRKFDENKYYSDKKLNNSINKSSNFPPSS